MAKDGKMSLPSVDGVKPGEELRLQKSEVIEPIETAEKDGGYTDQLICYRAVDVRLKQAAHREAFRDKMRKLIDDGATLKDGTPVSAKTDVFKWFLENCV